MELKPQIWSYCLQAIKQNYKSLNLIYETKFYKRDSDFLQLIKFSSSAMPNLENVQKVEFSKAHNKKPAYKINLNKPAV